MGPAGTVLYIYDKNKAGQHRQATCPVTSTSASTPSKDNMFNTPPVFAVYTSMLTLRWLQGRRRCRRNAEAQCRRAELLYGEIDRNPLFNGFAQADSAV